MLGLSDKIENSYILDTKVYLIPIRRPIWSNFVFLPGDHKMLEEGFVPELCKLYLLFQGLEAQCTSLRPVSRRLGRKRHQQFHFFWLHHGQNFYCSRTQRLVLYSSSVKSN